MKTKRTINLKNSNAALENTYIVASLTNTMTPEVGSVLSGKQVQALIDEASRVSSNLTVNIS